MSDLNSPDVPQNLPDVAPILAQATLDNPEAFSKQDIPHIAQAEAAVSGNPNLPNGNNRIATPKTILQEAGGALSDFVRGYQHGKAAMPLYEEFTKDALQGDGSGFDSEGIADKIAKLPKPEGKGFWGSMPGNVGDMLGGMTANWKLGAGMVAGGGLLGKAPGAGAGLAGYMGLTAGIQSTGQFIDRMRDEKAPDGGPLDPELVAHAAVVLGLVNGVMGTVIPGLVAGKGGLLGSLVGEAGSNVMARMLLRPGVGPLLARIAGGFASAEAAQAAVGAVQELANIVAEDAVTGKTTDIETVGARTSEAAKSAAQTGLPLSAGEAVHASLQRGEKVAAAGTEAEAAATKAEDVGQAAQKLAPQDVIDASKAAADVTNLGELGTKAQVFQADKSKLRDFAQRVAEANDMKSVTYPRKALVDFFEKNNIDPTVTMPEVMKQLVTSDGVDDAQIRVEPGENAAYIASHKNFKDIRMDMRHADGFTLREIEDLSSGKEQPPSVDIPASAPLKPDLAGFKDVYQADANEYQKQLARSREGEIANNPMHSLVSFLQTGERLDNGPLPFSGMDPESTSDTAQPQVLDREKLAALGLKPNPAIPSGPNGLDPIDLAHDFGYTPAEFIKKYQEYNGLEAAVAADAQKQMPGAVDSRKFLANKISDAAFDATASALATETRASGKRFANVSVESLLRYAKDQAHNDVSKLRINTLEPQQFLDGYQAFNAAAEKAADADKAAYKMQALLELHRFQEATKALEDQHRFVENAVRLRDNPDTRGQIAQVGETHINAIDSALAAYGFRKPVEGRNVEPIGAYLKREVEERMADIAIDPNLEHTKASTPAQDFTVADSRVAQDFMGSLEHHILQINEYQGAPLEDVMNGLTNHIRDNRPAIDRAKRDPAFERNMTLGRKMIAALTKPETAIRILDGGEMQGWIAQHLLQPMVDAAGFHEKMRQLVAKSLENLASGLDKNRLSELTDLAPNNAFGNKPGHPLSRADLIAALLNYGSFTNRSALLEGSGLTHPELMQAFSKHLNANEAAFVNNVWRLVQSVFPDVNEAYLKSTGVNLDQVQPMPFELKTQGGAAVQMEGGYYPIKREIQGPIRWKVPGFNAEDVKDSFVQKRGGGQGPINLQLPVLIGHLENKIHYAAMYNAIKDANKIVEHPEFQSAVRDTLGPEYNQVFRDWLDNAARNGMPQQAMSVWDKIQKQGIMGGAAMYSVGLNLKTVLLRPLGLIPSLAQINPKHYLSAIADITTDFKSTYERAETLSNEIGRIDTDFSGWAGKLNLLMPDLTIGTSVQRQFEGLGSGKIFRTAGDVQNYLQRLGMSHIAAMHKFCSLLSFVASEKQATEMNHPDPVGFADAAIRQYQGGVSMNDLPSIITRPGMARSTMMFYSYASTIANEMIRAGYSIEGAARIGGVGGALLRETVPLVTMLVLPNLLQYFGEEKYKDKPVNTNEMSWFFRAQVATMATRAIPLGIGDSFGQLMTPDSKHGTTLGGPMGQLTGILRRSENQIGKGEMPYEGIADASSIIFKVPTKHLYDGTTFALDLMNGKYGNDGYGVFMRGKKAEGYR